MERFFYERKLRKEQTPWENKLWYYLRDRRCSGLKFRRQVRIDKFIVDFYCAEKKFIIEVDGGQHNEEGQSNTDLKRDRELYDLGYIVLRVWNNDIEQNIEGVVLKILEMTNSLTPNPSP